MARELRLLLVGRGRHREAQQHRVAVVGHAFGEGRMPAPVLEVTVLAGARIEQGPKPVGGVGRGRRRDPVLAEDGVADLEIELALEVEIAGGVRRRRWRWSTLPREVAPPPGLSSPGSSLREVRRRGASAPHRRHRRRRRSSARANEQRQGRAEAPSRHRARREASGFGDAPAELEQRDSGYLVTV